MAEVSIHTIAGHEVLHKMYNFSAPIVIDLSNQLDGFYFVKVKMGTNETTQKIILRK